MFGLNFFGSNKSIVGLDIGSNSIKAVELQRNRGEVVVSHLGMELLASDIVVDSMIVDSGSVASAISKIFAEHAFKAKQVATSVSGHSVIVKKISMQTMDEPELGDAVRNEAAQYIPFDMNDVNVDYQVLSDSLAGGREEGQNPELYQRPATLWAATGDRRHRRICPAELLRIQL